MPGFGAVLKKSINNDTVAGVCSAANRDTEKSHGGQLR